MSKNSGQSHRPVAPVRERGLKLVDTDSEDRPHLVAPVRERGLKFGSDTNNYVRMGRSRKGAWIEINFLSYRDLSGKSLP